jgi:hypothetical protein
MFGKRCLVLVVCTCLLLGCVPARLHVLIPDFRPSGVDGLKIYLVSDSGGLQPVGRVVFGDIVWTPNGLAMQYTQLVPGRGTLGPLVAPAKQPAKGQLELELTLFHDGAPGRYRIASFNEYGTSPLASGTLYVGG